MFIAHYGVGFAARKIGRNVSLGTLFLASQFIDLIWPILILLGIERVAIVSETKAPSPLSFEYYPFSHSLSAVLLWAILLAALYYFIRRRAGNAILIGALVLSHWLLDLLVHMPDLQLWPWSETRVGLGLWESARLSIVLESTIFAAGALIYLLATRARNRIGHVSLYGLLAFLAVMYLLNIVGPPPDTVEPVAIVGLSQWLLVAWGYWIDRHRDCRTLNGTR